MTRREPQLREEIRRACAEADGFRDLDMEPHDYQGHADALLKILHRELLQGERSLSSPLETVRQRLVNFLVLGTGMAPDAAQQTATEILTPLLEVAE